MCEQNEQTHTHTHTFLSFLSSPEFSSQTLGHIQGSSQKSDTLFPTLGICVCVFVCVFNVCVSKLGVLDDFTNDFSMERYKEQTV